MQPYKKIDLRLSLDDVQQGDVTAISYGIVVDGDFQGIRYNNCMITDAALTKLHEAIPEKYRQHFRPTFMHINRDIIPHIDSGVKTVINTYLKAGGYQTDFNSVKEGRESFQIANQTDGKSWLFEDVDVLCSFVAEDGDSYILDVTQIHSVHSGKDKDRYALTLSTDLPYDEVCRIVGVA